MLVKELISNLEKFDPEMEVGFAEIYSRGQMEDPSFCDIEDLVIQNYEETDVVLLRAICWEDVNG